MRSVETGRQYITREYPWRPTNDGLLVTEVGRKMWGLTFPEKAMGYEVDSPNIWVVAGRNGTAIIDTSFGDKKEVNGVNIIVRELTYRPLLGIILTHQHFDHRGGVRLLRRGKRANVPILTKDSISSLPDGIFDLGGRRLQLIQTPGHTKDSICILEEQEHVLFTGDTILGSLDTVTVEEDGMGEYLASLELLDLLNPKIICSGHGPVMHDAKEKIARVRFHFLERHEQIFAEISSGNTEIDAIEEALYPESLWGLAEGQIRSHIYLLIEQERVKIEDGRLVIVS